MYWGVLFARVCFQLFVYGIIKKHWNKDRNDAYPSLKTISEEAGLAINTIRKCIKNLEGKYFKIE